MEDNPIPTPNQEQETTTTTTTMDTHQSSIASFMEITSSSHQEALFFLESHNFDLDNAVSTFLESTAFTTTVPPPVATADATNTAADDPDYLSPQDSSPSGSLSPSSSRSRSRSPPSGARSGYNLRSKKNASESSGRRRTRGGGGGGGVRTLADLNRNSDADASDGGDDDDDDDEDDNIPQYYTGGQRSGMVVEDPSKGNDIESIFEQARRRVVQKPVDLNQPSSSSRSFTGTARLLSGELVSSSPSEQAPEVVTHTITLWRNGFTVDDGPLRRFDDEENAPMLKSIKNSEYPKELQPADKKTAVHVNLVRRDENYHEPKKPKKPNSAFKGVGRTLGTSSSTSSEPSAVPAVMNSAPSPMMGLVVDDKVPSTSIQLRLADGTRMVSRFNYHHTVRDIHAFIDALRPARVGAYTLQIMGFPPKPLTDIDQTIEGAGLANSVVIQKF